jgi:hypothetical protein
VLRSNCRSPDGTQIDESDEQPENTEFSIRNSVKPEWNVLIERELHRPKQYWQIISTEEGIQIDESDEQSPNA